MASSAKILAFAGSTRRDSFNKKTVRVAADGARSAGAEVTVIDLKDYPLPLFDQDSEAAEGVPENVLKLKKLFIEHQGLLIASPEYNSSVTPVLKNVIDWVSRPVPGEAPMGAFSGKVAGLVSASPGAFGGLRGLVHLRAILGNIGVIVLPEQMAVSKAHEVFNEDGSMKDAKQQAAVAAIGKRVAETAAKLR